MKANNKVWSWEKKSVDCHPWQQSLTASFISDVCIEYNFMYTGTYIDFSKEGNISNCQLQNERQLQHVFQFPNTGKNIPVRLAETIMTKK